MSEEYWREKAQHLNGLLVEAEKRLANSQTEGSTIWMIREGQARAERDALRTALERYGQHEKHCGFSEISPCRCGLREALRGRDLVQK